MNPSHEREQALFILAAAKPAAERAEFLDRECGADKVLRARLEALLAAHERTEPVMDAPVGQAKGTMKLAFSDPPDEIIGQKIGRYKILEKVGEGGCGVVYVAEQTESVRRRVALKVIKLGMDTKQVVARFEAERQALAMMDHPNIAKVLDVGSTETGRPYFVMELVRGIRITDYCDQNNLPTKDRLDLFMRVCHAIQHAHQKGIIHRDIKPSNILVTLHDGVPVPKVIDFGIAKATEGRLTEHTVYTQLHQFIGTPAYMSPEQAEMSGLDIDTRSDIYSLGVLLYELLTGKTPFDTKELMSLGLDAMRKTIREQDPVRPSTKLGTLQRDDLTTTAKRRSVDSARLAKLVQGDLDWIVMKCLEKDRTRRYETANGLAADLKRHLDNEAVIACPPSSGYRFQKLVRRNKIAFAAGTAIAASLVIGIAVSMWQAVLATQAKREALAARQQAETNEKKAVAETERAAKAESVAVHERETARQALAMSQLDLAEKEFERGKFVEAQKIIEATPEPFRDANWRFLSAHSKDFAAELSLHGFGTVYRLYFLPGGDRFLAKGWYGFVRTFDLQGRPIGQAFKVRRENFMANFGCDRSGTRIAFAVSTNEVAVQELATGKMLGHWNCDLTEIDHVLLSPEGDVVLAIGGSKVIACAAMTGAPLWTQSSIGAMPAFSPDGRTAAVLSAMNGLDLKVQLLDTSTGTVRSTLEASADDPGKEILQFNEAGDRLACLGGDEMIVWDLRTARKIRTLHFPGESPTLLNPTGDILATTAGARIRLRDSATGQLLRSLNGARADVSTIAFSSDGKLLLSAHVSGGDSALACWLVRLPEEKFTVRSPGNGFDAHVFFGRDGSTLYAVNRKAIGAWDTHRGTQKWMHTGPKVGFLDAVVDPSDESLLVGDWSKVTFTRLSREGEVQGDFGHSFATPYDLSLSRDERWLATADSYGIIRVLDVATGNELTTSTNMTTRDTETAGRVQTAFCLDDRAIAAQTTTAGGITIWDWKTGTPMCQIAAAQTGTIRCLAASPDGKRLATSGPDRWIRVWDGATGRLETAFRAHWESVNCVKFSPDGREILSGGEDGTVRLHDAATGEETLALYGHSKPVIDVAFSPDGALIAAISDDAVTRVWNRKLSSEAASLPEKLSAERKEESKQPRAKVPRPENRLAAQGR